jgi:hypothetical protein
VCLSFVSSRPIVSSSRGRVLGAAHVLISERTSFAHWHSRLGHPAMKVCAHVVSKFGLPVFNNKSLTSYNTYLSSKSKQLSFSLSSTSVNSPLELIYIYVWGPSPISSSS